MGNEPGRPVATGQPGARRNTGSDRTPASELVKNKTINSGTEEKFKIYVLGDQRTGKTRLLKTLSKAPDRAQSNYTHTSASQATEISWDFSINQLTVMVEFWEIILPITRPGPLELPVDPSVRAAIFMLDPRRKSTFDYVKRILPQVPNTIDALIVSNFTDCLQDNRKVTMTQIKSYANDVGSHIKCCEASLENQFGLKAIRAFISVPFARFEFDYLREQTARAEKDFELANDGFLQIAGEQDYSFYKQWLARALPKAMKSAAPIAKPVAGKNASPIPTIPAKTELPTTKGEKSREELPKAKSTSSVDDKSKPAAPTQPAKPAEPKTAQPPSQVKQGGAPPAGGRGKPPQKPPAKEGGLFSKLKSIVSSEDVKGGPRPKVTAKSKSQSAMEFLKVAQTDPNATIDNFDPSALDGGNEYDNFFGSDDDDEPAPVEPFPDDESSEEDEENPLVEADQDFDASRGIYHVQSQQVKRAQDSSKPKPTAKPAPEPVKPAQAPKPTPEPVKPVKAPKEPSAKPEVKSKSASDLVATAYEVQTSSDDEPVEPIPAPTKDDSLDELEDFTPAPPGKHGFDDSSSEDAPNPFVTVAEDSSEDAPNPFVTVAEDSSEDTPNPLVAVAEDSSEDAPNPLVTVAEDSSEEFSKSDVVQTAYQTFSESDEELASFTPAAKPEIQEDEEDFAPNPLVAVPEDVDSEEEFKGFVPTPSKVAVVAKDDPSDGFELVSSDMMSSFVTLGDSKPSSNLGNFYDDDSDDTPNPLVAAAEDFYGDVDDEPSPVVEPVVSKKSKKSSPASSSFDFAVPSSAGATVDSWSFGSAAQTSGFSSSQSSFDSGFQSASSGFAAIPDAEFEPIGDDPPKKHRRRRRDKNDPDYEKRKEERKKDPDYERRKEEHRRRKKEREQGITF